LQQWHDQGLIRWQRLSQPHLVQAMNRGLLAARGELVLFVDDDIVPLPGLVQGHIECHGRYPEAWAVVGQILQPGQAPADLPQRPHPSPFWRDLDFPFNRTRGAWVENAMAGNLSVKRERLLAIGGFNASFPPPVASRFESELAKRLVPVLREGVKRLREIFRQSAFDPWRGAELSPGPEVQSDAQIDAWIRTNADTVYHPTSSCRMGPDTDPMAVLDPQCRVRGVKGLRVVDASSLPKVPSGNTAAPVYMLAERIADVMRGRAVI
jgi:hypothetical protein